MLSSLRLSTLLLAAPLAALWPVVGEPVRAQDVKVGASARTRAEMARLPEGTYRPLYGRSTDAPKSVQSFLLDRDAVTRGAYLAFVRANPQWRRDAIDATRAERASYLADWRGPLDPGAPADLRRPVTGVSWFAARAYCEAQGRRLPTIVEWEYAASASETQRDASRDSRFSQQVLALYASRPRPLPPVDAGVVNVYGIRGLHGLAWEWVEDFRGAQNAHDAHHSDHSHHDAAVKHDQSCAGAAIGASDASNYPAFLRYAIRSGATARTTLSTMGFRCAA